MSQSKIITPFDPEYISQIVPFKTRKGQKRPDLNTVPTFPLDSIASSVDEGKRARLRKTSI